MPDDDLSTIPGKKNYKGVVIQQGRVPLDTDSNENDVPGKNKIGKAGIELHIKAFIQQANNHLLADTNSTPNLPVKGFRALFHGPPNTGKTSTAELIAKNLNKDLHKVDLAKVVSKYIRETEKNLELLFARAEDKGWILYFDEADALFGKRSDVRDSHDRYANHEVSYLLQRISKFRGLIIVSVNSTDMDKSVPIEFDMGISFPLPSA